MRAWASRERGWRAEADPQLIVSATAFGELYDWARLRTISAAGCEVRDGLGHLGGSRITSPSSHFCWSCVLMDYPPLCPIWSADIFKYSASDLYPVNPTAFIRDLGQGSLPFFFSLNLHLVETVGMPWVNDCVTFEGA